MNTNYTKINDINIHYKLEGEENKNTLVFIHGLSDSLEYWKPLTNELKKDYKILSYDIRGNGKSENGKEKATINTYQEDLYKLLKKLNITNAIFIGFSMGGNIALKIATQHPEITKGLILFSTYCETTDDLKEIFRLFEDSLNINYETFYKTIMEYCLPYKTLNKHKDKLDKIKNEKSKTADKSSILDGIHTGSNFTVKDELKNINSPCLILAGADDEITTVSMQETIHKNIKNSKIVVFEDTKHNILLGKNISKVNNLIKEFLKKS